MYWPSPETRNRTLEEIKEIFDGEPLHTAEVIREGGETKQMVEGQDNVAERV